MNIPPASDGSRENDNDKEASPSRLTEQAVLAEYAERVSRFEAQFRTENALWERVGNFRLAVFLLGVAALGYGLWQQQTLVEIAGLVLLVAFFVLIGYHRAINKRRRRYEEIWKINQEATWRVLRDWERLPLRHEVRASADEPYAADLDIFGHASLFHLLDTVTTQRGEAALASWLRSFASPGEVVERQRAVAELAPMVGFRDELELRGRLIKAERPDPERFLAWAESEPWLARRRWLSVGAIVSTVVVWALIFAQVFGLVPYPLWAVLAIINIGITVNVVRNVEAGLSQASSVEANFRYYASAFELLCDQRFDSPMLAGVRSSLGADNKDANAPGLMRRLYRVVTRRIPPSAMLYIPIQAVTLWDIHLLGALERWQMAAGKHVRSWLDALGQVEALSALARLSHDSPGWNFPGIDPIAGSVVARGLGHPLIPEERRVCNDVEVGPPGTFLLVTGSNMSGKSTLLRSIGVNVALAGAGGPVCAVSMSLPPVDLWTSMRVEDSLERGVSYYMAELQRLKRVVDAARTGSESDHRRVLYLLDEILQGTNTTERQIAARRVISYLVRQGAIGAVSTHDLGLVEDSELSTAARMVHFVETISNGQGGPVMTFDYKLRPGIATSSNALRLLEIVGIRLDDAPA